MGAKRKGTFSRISNFKKARQSTGSPAGGKHMSHTQEKEKENLPVWLRITLGAIIYSLYPQAKHPYYGDRMFRCARRARVLCQRRHDTSIRDAFPIWLLSITCPRFANRSRRFIDTYDKGLNGKQAAWAARKYCGHCVLPDLLMNDLEKANFN